MLLLWLNYRDVGIRPLLQFPHLLRVGPVLTLLLFPSSFILPSFARFYMFFSSGQVLLSALSWCSACTSMSEDVFLMYPWRETYFTSNYSSAILFSHLFSKSIFLLLYHVVLCCCEIHFWDAFEVDNVESTNVLVKSGQPPDLTWCVTFSFSNSCSDIAWSIWPNTATAPKINHITRKSACCEKTVPMIPY